MNVIYLAGGFPTQDNPSHGLFNLRAVNALRKECNLIVVHYRMLKPGRKLHEEFQEDGYTRHVLCVPIVPLLQHSVYSLNNRIFRFFTNYYLKDLLEKAHVVHASDGNLGVMMAQLKRHYNFKLITQFIGGDLNQDLYYQRKKLIEIDWKSKLDAVTFNSFSLQTVFHSLFGIHDIEKIIYRGVDVNQFIPKENQSTSPIVFYFLGGLPNYSWFSHGRNTKGGRTLMEAWGMLDKAGKVNNSILKFAGPDSNIDEVLRWKNGLKYPNNVDIVGTVDPFQIANFHRYNHVAVIPSLEEGLPNVLLEAGASGSAIIASKVGGIPEVIPTEKHGVLIKPNSPDELAEAIHMFIVDPFKITEYGIILRSFIEENFSNPTFAIKYLNLYKQLIN